MSCIEGLENRCLLAQVPAGFSDEIIADGLDSPTAMAVAPDGRTFIAEQSGIIRVIKDGKLLPAPFHIFTDIDGSFERGLLGIELDPNFESNGYVYTYGTTTENGTHNRVTRLTAQGDVSKPGSKVNLIDFQSLDGAIYHMGGALHFGTDGKLYVAVGDHQYFDGTKIQTIEVPFGKILRFNRDGSIPTDNPFYSTAVGINRSTWVYGLRNPFTFNFQPGTGRLFINDVGQETWEEIDEGIKGHNYGWPLNEGPVGLEPGFTAPIYYYKHDEGIAITGATFYNPASEQFPTEYVGRYFFGDLGSGFVRTLDPGNNNQVTPFASGLVAPVDFDVALDGSLYYLQRGADLNSGSVGRISFDQSLNNIPRISAQPQSQIKALGQSETFTAAASGPTLKYQWTRDGQNLTGQTKSTLKISAVDMTSAGEYQVRVTNSFGSALSDEATLTVLNEQPPVPKIVSPVSGAHFRAGQTLTLDARGQDPEDGKLGPSKFTWQVDYYTGNVVRPFYAATSGQRSVQVTIPTETPYTKTNVFYRARLTVKDSAGVTKSITRDIKPIIARVTLTTNIGRATLTLDEQPKTGPLTFAGVAGVKRVIGAPLNVTVNGVSYIFDHWSDGGQIEHEILTPLTDSTYTARYRRTSQATQTQALRPTADSYVFSGATTQRSGAATSLLADDQHTVYLKFDLSDLTAPIQDAKLRLFAALDSNADQNVKLAVYAAPGAKWSEAGLDYADRPPTKGKALASAVVNDNSPQWYELDLTAFLQQQYQLGRRVVTLVIRGTSDSAALVDINSRENLENRVELSLAT
jgi:glucose/arabinose dehydrogenase